MSGRRVVIGLAVAALLVGLGSTYFFGLCFQSGVAALKDGDYDEARKRLRVLAWFGYDNAQLIMGEMYAFGLGVVRDDAIALEWFSKIAKEDAMAEKFHVGERYLRPGGTAADTAIGLKWLKLAAEDGHSGARQRLAEIRQKGLFGVPIDPEAADAPASSEEKVK